MSTYGAKYLKWAPFAGAEPAAALPNYGLVIELAEVVKVADSPQYANTKVHGGNRLVHDVNEFSSAGLDTEITELVNSAAATVYGVSNVSDLEFGEDSPPYGGLVLISCLKQNDGSKKYQGVYYPKVQAKPLDAEEYNTKGENLVFVNEKIKFTAFKPNYGKWKIKSPLFSTEPQATDWCDAKLGNGSFYYVDVSVNGADVGEAVSPLGKTYISAGESFELDITGTATALYDNGTDAVGSISNGKFTISNIAANHTLSVIF